MIPKKQQQTDRTYTNGRKMVDIIARRRRFVSQDKQTSALSIISSRPYQFFFSHSTTTHMWNGSNIKRRPNQEMRKRKKTIKNKKEITPVFVLVFLLVAYE